MITFNTTILINTITDNSRWEFGVDHHDIKFSIKRRDQDGNEEVVHGPRKVSEGPVDVGVLSATGPATCEYMIFKL